MGGQLFGRRRRHLCHRRRGYSLWIFFILGFRIYVWHFKNYLNIVLFLMSGIDSWEVVARERWRFMRWDLRYLWFILICFTGRDPGNDWSLKVLSVHRFHSGGKESGLWWSRRWASWSRGRSGLVRRARTQSFLSMLRKRYLIALLLNCSRLKGFPSWGDESVCNELDFIELLVDIVIGFSYLWGDLVFEHIFISQNALYELRDNLDSFFERDCFPFAVGLSGVGDFGEDLILG